MKKYIATENHATIKPGVVLSVNKSHKVSMDDGTIIGISKDKFLNWVSSGMIKEIQEPKWTDNQLKEFYFCCKNRDWHMTEEEFIEKWINPNKS